MLEDMLSIIDLMVLDAMFESGFIADAVAMDEESWCVSHVGVLCSMVEEWFTIRCSACYKPHDGYYADLCPDCAYRQECYEGAVQAGWFD